MIKVIKLNIKTIYKNNTFGNFILLNFFLICFLIIIVGGYFYCANQIEKIINDESNREFFIYEKLDVDDIKEFNFEDVLYEVIMREVNINNHYYNIISNDDKDTKMSIMINSIHKNAFSSYAKQIEIIVDKKINEDTIYVNQSIAKILYNQKYNEQDTFIILIRLRDYKKVNAFEDYLKAQDINYSINNESLASISTYQDLQTIVLIFCLIILTITVIILVILYTSIILENQRNIKIYNVIGLSLRQIKIIYIFSILFYITIIFLILGIIMALILLMLLQLYNYNFISYYCYIILLPYLIYCVISSLVIILVIRIVKYKHKIFGI